jgi:hypothetical protein
LSAVPCVLQLPHNIGPNAVKLSGFRLFPFRSPLLRESLEISFPQVTKMFQFSCLPLAKRVPGFYPGQVILLGNPQLGLLDNSLRLIAVMPRPSSATDAKAFALCPFLFDLLQLEHKTEPTIHLLMYTFLGCELLVYIKSYFTSIALYPLGKGGRPSHLLFVFSN